MIELGFLINKYPVILGCDVSGVIIEKGNQVTNDVQLGDIIYAFNPLGVENFGTFAEYCLVDGFQAHKIPHGWTPEQGSTIGVPAMTAYLGLFWKDFLGLSNTHGDNQQVLVWGGSSAVGMAAVQLLAGLGYQVLATCSAKHIEYIRSLGAAHVFDYNHQDVMQHIRDASNNQLKFAMDCVGDDRAYLVLEGQHPAFIGFSARYTVPDNLPKNVKAYIVGLAAAYYQPECITWVSNHCSSLIDRLVHENGFMPPNIELFHGIEHIKDALVRQKSGVSGTKVVVTLNN